jgi:hypothetical protein
MNWFWANIPVMVAFFAAIAGIPLWLTLRRPDTGPAMLATSSLAESVATLAPLLPEAELVGAS